jgi:NADH-quinone oxidoreductase subunit L
MDTKSLYLLIALLPLVGSVISGLFGWAIGRRAAHFVTIFAVAVSAILSAKVLMGFWSGESQPYNENLYTWLTMGGFDFSVGFLVDGLTAMMMVVITSVSLMVHVYTIGYMAEDAGYQRFFSYLSLFTFSMLMLVMSNNFIQLFFGWEAVGLVSYLLIGFWFDRPTAIYANLKAFLVNRVGDFGFLLGIALVLFYFGGSLDYAQVFAQVAPALATVTISLFPGLEFSLLTVTCILLFVGAMGKSAQFPLHVWLPDSMEGPTPISALIHAATMVTAGIFMVARMSPLFELSDTALNFIMIVGSITALFMGFLGVIQTDIKRVVAYSTLSQLGYMTIALGASVYSMAVFHVMTHAFFKALLFLGAGSVIMSMHHDQDMRNMGALRKYLPITWITSLFASFSLVGMPFFSGFYSKDSIIEAVALSHLPASNFAYFAVLASVFVTALYSFRMYFMVFHGKEKWMETTHHEAHMAEMDQDHADTDHHHGLGPHDTPKESSWVVTLPLVLLAIPSVVIGFFTIKPLVYGKFFGSAIQVNDVAHPVMSELTHEFHGATQMAIHGMTQAPFILMLLGIFTAWICYIKVPSIPANIKKMAMPIYVLLDNKYYLDHLYYAVFAKGSRALGGFFWKICDMMLIDGLLVNGSAKLVQVGSLLMRRLQTGFIYTYAIVMVLGVMFLVAWQFTDLFRAFFE